MATFSAQYTTVRDAPAVDYRNEGAGTAGLKRGQIAKVVAGLIVPWAAAADVNLVVLAQDASGVAGTPIAYYQLTSASRFEMTLEGVALVGDVSGTQVDLVSAGAGLPVIAARTTVTPRVEILETRIPLGTQNGITGDTRIRVLVKPLNIQANWA